MVPALQIVAIATFLGLGILRSRWPDKPWPGRELWVNLATGAALVSLRLGLTAVAGWLGWTIGRGIIPLGALPWPIVWLAGFLGLDFARYALHRMHHRVPFFWQFHAVHHSAPRLDATTGLRMHVVDFLQLAALPLVLFGWVFDLGQAPTWLFAAMLVPGVLFDAFEHADLRLEIRSPFWRRWDRVFNNPHFHAWHHTDDGHLRDGNYGNVLTVWDRWLGTCVSGDGLPAGYGLDPASRLVEHPVGLQMLVKEL